MERKTGIFGLADFVLAKNRRQATFLDAVIAIIDWKRIEKVLTRGIGRSNEITTGAKAYTPYQDKQFTRYCGYGFLTQTGLAPYTVVKITIMIFNCHQSPSGFHQ